jgi:hypothetical protein
MPGRLWQRRRGPRAAPARRRRQLGGADDLRERRGHGGGVVLGAGRGVVAVADDEAAPTGCSLLLTPTRGNGGGGTSLAAVHASPCRARCLDLVEPRRPSSLVLPFLATHHHPNSHALGNGKVRSLRRSIGSSALGRATPLT